MGYPLNPNFPDEITLSGVLGTDNAKWSHVMHGYLTAGAANSTALLTQMASEFGPGAGTPLEQLSVNLSFLKIQARQVRGFKYRYGRAGRILLTLVGGSITGVTIVDVGQGLPPSVVISSPVYDSAVPGGAGGGVEVTTNAAGSIVSAIITSPGNGYTNAFVDLEAPLAPPGKENDQRIVYGAVDVLFPAGPPIGAVAGDSAPSFNAVSTRLHSAGLGRSGQGHAHWAGVAEVNTLQDGWAVGKQALLQTAATTWFVTPFQVPTPSANTWQPGVLSRKKLFELDASPVTVTIPFCFNPITSIAVNPNVGSETRRKQPNP